MKSNSWTDEEIETLKALWSAGKTSPEIVQLMGKTRSAIMGKVHRLKLKTVTEPRARGNKPGSNGKTCQKRRKIPLKPPFRPEALTSLLDLGPCMCRYSFGSPGEPGFGFCGERTERGKTYCAEHVPVVSRKIVKVKQTHVMPNGKMW